MTGDTHWIWMQSTGASFPCSFLSGATIPHFPKGLGTNLVFDRRRLERNPALVADLTFTGRAGLNREKPRFSMFSSRQTPSLPNGEPSQTGINVAFDSDIRGIAREKPRFIGKNLVLALENLVLSGTNLVFARKNEVCPNHRWTGR